MKKWLLQALGFVGLSGIGWLLDFGTFTALGLISANVVLNNMLSSWVGVTFVFLTATRKVFRNNSRMALKWKYLIYLGYQLILIFLISWLLGQVNGWLLRTFHQGLLVEYSTLVSKLLVTPVTMTLNFFVMKGVIEKL